MPKKTIGGLLKAYFITGLLVLLPLALTYWILTALLQSMEQLIGNPIQHYLDIYIPGMGIILLVTLILLVGIFARNFIGKKLGQWVEKVLRKIPLVSNVYSWIKELVNTIFHQGKSSFREVVLVEYPRRGTYTIGFITGDTRGEVRRVADQEMVNVFLPTTPNPTSGFFLMFPESEVKKLEMTVDEGLKMLISAGIATPPDRAALPEQEVID